VGLIVVDTMVLIDNLRDIPVAVAALDAARDDGHSLLASVVTKVELFAGMRSHERKVTRELMATMQWVEVSEDIADVAGGHARRFRASHRGIGIADFLVGATAEHLGADLWTRNVRHFPMFPDLRPPY
jgi:predicted nucleic acid-binding protein